MRIFFLDTQPKAGVTSAITKNLKKIVESTYVKVAEHDVNASDDGSNVEDAESD